MIKIDVEGYCHQCRDFVANVIPAQRTVTPDGELQLGDTIVQCEHRRRCAGIKRYLEQQIKGGVNG